MFHVDERTDYLMHFGPSHNPLLQQALREFSGDVVKTAVNHYDNCSYDNRCVCTKCIIVKRSNKPADHMRCMDATHAEMESSLGCARAMVVGVLIEVGIVLITWVLYRCW